MTNATANANAPQTPATPAPTTAAPKTAATPPPKTATKAAATTAAAAATPQAEIAFGNISKREFFAAMAMQGLAAKGFDVSGDRVMQEWERCDATVARSFNFADAMIRFINKTPKK